MALSESTQKSIAAFDAKLDTSLQLNSSKVPAQEDVFSLIIGVGGTGVDALLEAKGMVNKTCCLDETHKDKPTNHVAYLAIDTDDAARQKNSSQRSGGAKLDTQKGELIQLSNPDMDRFLSPDSNTWIRSRLPSLTFRCTRTVSPTWTTGGSSLVYLSVKAFIRSMSISSCCIGVHASHPAALQNRRGGHRGPPVISD